MASKERKKYKAKRKKKRKIKEKEKYRASKERKKYKDKRKKKRGKEKKRKRKKVQGWKRKKKKAYSTVTTVESVAVAVPALVAASRAAPTSCLILTSSAADGVGVMMSEAPPPMVGG